MNDEQLMTMQQMLATCLNPDNNVRRGAEEQITAHLNGHREVFIYGLTKLIRTSSVMEVRERERARTGSGKVEESGSMQLRC